MSVKLDFYINFLILNFIKNSPSKIKKKTT